MTLRIFRGVLCTVSFVFAPIVAGCDSSSQEASTFVVRDSAGVRIIDNTHPSWSPDERWQLVAEPSLSIGAADGSEPYLFFGILGVRRLTDGRIVVANRGTSELRIFDEEGRFLESVGREGDGPGEFRFMSLFWSRAGDTLVVSDMRGLTVIDPQGRYNRTIQLQPAGGRRVQPVGQIADGTILASSSTGAGVPSTPGITTRDSMLFYAFGADASVRAALTTVPRAEIHVPENGIGMGRRVPLAAHPAWTAAADRFYLTSAREAELTVWRPDGTLEGMIRWPEPAAVTPEHIARYREHALATTRNEDSRRQQEQFLASVTMPQRLPSTGEINAIVAADDGHLWVEAYRLPWIDQPEWLIFSPEGVWLGSVQVPPNFSLQQVIGDSVIGIWRDEAGVEYVRIHQLRRGIGHR